MKKVLFIIIDALATRVVEPAIQSGKLPNFSRLVDAGVMRSDCISIFPSITPAATCTLATGCYPREHGIAGAYWYDTDRDEVAYFGTDIWAILNEGVTHYLHDFQQELNKRRLQVPTVFEQIERHGHLRDAVINLLWFRGTVDHAVTLPAAFKLLADSEAESMRGPHLMFMGDFVNTPLDRTGKKLSARGGILRRYGFHDETSADYLLNLAREFSLPEFTLAYFPDNDFESHEHGPSEAVECLEKVDQYLGQLFELHGGLSKMLEEFAILITGDHSQSDLSSAAEAAIDLNQVLANFQVVEAGAEWQSGDDLMVCPNMRSAQIYLRCESWKRRQEVINCLLSCTEIDQVFWCETAEDTQTTGQTNFHVATQDRGMLQFWPANQQDAAGTDHFGGPWAWKGNLTTVDARATNAGQLEFGDYPNALERIATSFLRESGNLWVTARLGSEFCLPETNCHEGGSHGSLHALDSTSPLIAAGLPQSIDLPEHVRTVDVIPLCLLLLDLEPNHALGASHMMNLHS